MSNLVPAPVLDTRNGDLVTAEAIQSFPAELSDRSDSNPAVVVTEANGSIFDAFLYQLNRWPQAVIQKALALVGATLLADTAASSPQQFVLSNPRSSDTVIPLGTLVSTQDGTVVFATVADLTIPAYSQSLAGTVATAAGSAIVTGTGTSFPTDSTWVGQRIQIPAQTGNWYTIASVSSATSLTLTATITAAVSGAYFVGAYVGIVNARSTSTGALSNIGTNTLTSVSSGISGVYSTTNTSAATGGADLETPAQAIIRAPLAFAARDIATSPSDYALFATKVLGLNSRAKALDNTNLTTLASGYVTTALLSPTWTTASSCSAQEITNVSRDLANRSYSSATALYTAANIQSFTTPGATPVVLFVRQTTTDDGTARTNIATALNTYLSPNTYPFGRTIFSDDLVNVANKSVGVDRVFSVNGVMAVGMNYKTTTGTLMFTSLGTTATLSSVGDNATMVANRTFVIDTVNGTAYLVTAISGTTLTLDHAYAGVVPGAASSVGFFTAGDLPLANWFSLPFAALSITTPPPSIVVVGVQT